MKKIFANPCTIVECQKLGKKQDNMNYNWVPAHFLDEHSAFVTKTFLIRFCEEEVSINDICIFRTEFDAYPMINEENLFFECELLFSDILNLKQVYKIN